MNERGIDKIRRLEEENEEKQANVRGLEEVTNCCPQYREVIVQLTGIGERERERERERGGVKGKLFVLNSLVSTSRTVQLHTEYTCKI